MGLYEILQYLYIGGMIPTFLFGYIITKLDVTTLRVRDWSDITWIALLWLPYILYMLFKSIQESTNVEG